MSDMTSEQMKEELERLRTENEALKKRSEEGLSLKVSQKGGVSVYGLGRFPVTLYKEQWEKLLDISDDIRTFIQENEPQLKTKGSGRCLLGRATPEALKSMARRIGLLSNRPQSGSTIPKAFRTDI